MGGWTTAARRERTRSSDTREQGESRGRENYGVERERGGVGVAEGRIAADGESE